MFERGATDEAHPQKVDEDIVQSFLSELPKLLVEEDWWSMSYRHFLQVCAAKINYLQIGLSRPAKGSQIQDQSICVGLHWHSLIQVHAYSSAQSHLVWMPRVASLRPWLSIIYDSDQGPFQFYSPKSHHFQNRTRVLLPCYLVTIIAHFAMILLYHEKSCQAALQLTHSRSSISTKETTVLNNSKQFQAWNSDSNTCTAFHYGCQLSCRLQFSYQKRLFFQESVLHVVI